MWLQSSYLPNACCKPHNMLKHLSPSSIKCGCKAQFWPSLLCFPTKEVFWKETWWQVRWVVQCWVTVQGAWVTQWPSLLSVDTHTSLMEGVLYLWSYLIFHLFLLPDLLPLFCPSCAWSPRQTLCHWLFLTYLSQFFYCCVGHHSTL